MSTQPPPDSPRDAKAELKAAKAYNKAQRPWYKKKRFIALGLFVLLVLASVGAGTSSETDNTADDPATSSPPPAASSDAAPRDDGDGGGSSCGTTATDDCTPEVTSDQTVRVDALTFKYVSSRTTSTLGDQQYGLGAKADDVFLVVKLSVTSNKNESATLTDNAIKLESSDGNTYSADSDGTVAAIGAGEDPLFLTDLGPDQTTTSKVVFDVPQRVLDAGAKLRFNELGFGSTHGYIRLPQK